jgi:hypothetical protein
LGIAGVPGGIARREGRVIQGCFRRHIVVF